MKPKKSQIKNVLTPGDIEAIGDLMGGLMDKQAAVLASKQDLKDLESKVDGIESKMATKQDLADLKDYMHQGFESVIEGMDAISEKLTQKEEFMRLVEWAKEVGEKVGIKPRI